MEIFQNVLNKNDTKLAATLPNELDSERCLYQSVSFHGDSLHQETQGMAEAGSNGKPSDAKRYKGKEIFGYAKQKLLKF
jgi:hypothetical protein